MLGTRIAWWLVALGLLSVMMLAAWRQPVAGEVWNIDLGQPIADGGLGDMGIDAQAGTVVVAAAPGSGHNGSLYLLDARSGALRRTIAVAASPLRLAMDDVDGRAFVLTAAPGLTHGTLYVVDIHRALALPRIDAGLQPTDMVVDRIAGRVFVERADGTGDIFAAGSGRRVHSLPRLSPTMLGTNYLAVAEHAGRVVVVDQYGDMVYLVDARSGRTIHQATGLNPNNPYVDQRMNWAFIWQAHMTTVRLAMLDLATGTLTWVDGGYDTGGEYPVDIPIVMDARSGAAIVVYPNTLQVLDGATGATQHVVPVGQDLVRLVVDAPLKHAFAIDAGVVDRQGQPHGHGHIIMLDERTWRVLATVAVGRGADEAAIDETNHRLFVANTADNTVSVLDAHTGALLYTVRVGTHPDRIVVSEHTGRVFVLHRGEAIPTLQPGAPPTALPVVRHASITMLDASQ